ncbi:hypothetical protein [Mycobacterium sp. 852002-51057_SCH5723018]|uniref:hypothetical protein n=1 Tax=Mycobacterium sp. 852002-51057_SCH5723018 TaxID=1834094 RepID=UPI0012E83C27|nr:hypothetical protein [Mycobacterium sp. 852002-51057_SCH5723018]
MWSFVNSASTYASLAGLLAGFQFAALSILLASGKAHDTETIGLFSAGFLTLGLDSYLFAQLSGLPKQMTGALCRLGWGQAVTAGGMLAVGSVALVCGLCWLLALREAFSPQQRIYLMGLGGLMVGAMVFVAIFRLCIAIMSYLRVVLPDAPAAVGPSIMTVGPLLGAILGINTVKRVRRAGVVDGSKDESLARLSRGTSFVVGYAVVSTVFATALAAIETISLSSNFGLIVRVGGTVLIATLLPAFVIYLLSSSIGRGTGTTFGPRRRLASRLRGQPT